MDALTGDNSEALPGLLTSSNKGCNDNGNGGIIDITFTLKTDKGYTYAGSTISNNSVIGSFHAYISVDSSDTEESILKDIIDSFNSSTIIDFNIYANSSNASTRYYNSDINTVMKDVEIKIDEVVYPDIQIPIHTGADAQNHMPITYEYLTLSSLGILNTNVRTEAAADSAVNEISDALTKLNTQRSIFGAYQNRLEKAAKINANVSENTQYSESVIRDTDMETELVKYSNAQIVQQAAQSMLAQANQMNQNVLELLE
jgi:flagellin